MMLRSDFCQGLPRGSSAPPRRQDDDNDEDDEDNAMHEECGFVMFCAFSVIFKKKYIKTTTTIKQTMENYFSSRLAFVSLSSATLKCSVACV